MIGPDRPEVTLTGGLPPPADLLLAGEDRAPRQVPRAVYVLASVALLLAATVGVLREEPLAVPADAIDAELVLVADNVTVTQYGVLVVPVELRNAGPRLVVRHAQVRAEPVRLDPEVRTPPDVEPLDTRRLVVLLAPDCRLLPPGRAPAFGTIEFAATLLLRVANGSLAQDVVLDVGRDPGILDRVAGLCGRSTPGVPFPLP